MQEYGSHKNWYFEEFSATQPNIHGKVMLEGIRAEFNNILVEVRKYARPLGSGLKLSYKADDIQIRNLPIGDLRLYEFIGLKCIGFGSEDNSTSPKENVSIIGKNNTTGDIASAVGDSVQWETLQGRITLSKPSLSVEEVKEIRASAEYQEAIEILCLLYRKISA